MSNHGLRTDRVSPRGTRLDCIVILIACLCVLNHSPSGKKYQDPGSRAFKTRRATSLDSRTKPGTAMLLCRQRQGDRHPVTHRSQGSSSLDFKWSTWSPRPKAALVAFRLNLHFRPALRRSLASNSMCPSSAPATTKDIAACEAGP